MSARASVFWEKNGALRACSRRRQTARTRRMRSAAGTAVSGCVVCTLPNANQQKPIIALINAIAPLKWVAFVITRGALDEKRSGAAPLWRGRHCSRWLFEIRGTREGGLYGLLTFDPRVGRRRGGQNSDQEQEKVSLSRFALVFVCVCVRGGGKSGGWGEEQKRRARKERRKEEARFQTCKREKAGPLRCCCCCCCRLPRRARGRRGGDDGRPKTGMRAPNATGAPRRPRRLPLRRRALPAARAAARRTPRKKT